MTRDQIDKQLSWLDEQRRKDTEHIGSIERKLESALELVNSQENQLKQLSSEVTRISAISIQIRQFDDAMEKIRDSYSQKLSDFESLFLERQKHQEDLRKHDYEELAKAVSEVRVQLVGISEIKDAMEARKQEEFRIQAKMDSIDERIERLTITLEEQSRNLNAIGEIRKQDAKRITDLQSESTELRTKMDSQRGVQDALEDRLRRVDTSLQNLSSNFEKRTEIYSLWEEKQELRMVGFEKKWKEWNKVFESVQQKAEEVDERILKSDENFRLLSQTRMDLDKVIQKLERRISEISEMQRFNEERIKQEWSNFQADEQKRWNTHKLTSDELWRDHSRIHEKITQELQSISERLNESIIAIDAIAEGSRQRIGDLVAVVNEWAESIDRKIDEIR
jgi:chromosome segregation ATPase